MNGILAAALPVFGLLACLFVGFILLSSESRSGERIAYVFFGVGVAWLIASGTVLWPKVSHAKAANVWQANNAVQPGVRAAQPYAYRGNAPANGYGYGSVRPYGYAYAYGYPQPGYYPYGYYR